MILKNLVSEIFVSFNLGFAVHEEIIVIVASFNR